MELTIPQKEKVLETVEFFIEYLDDASLNQIFQGYGYDVNRFMDEVENAVAKVFMFNKLDPVDSADYNFINGFQEHLDEVLRKTNLNYFVANTMPDFLLSWYNIEWFNNLMLYNKMSVLAPRGHGKSHSFSFAYPLFLANRYSRAEADAFPMGQIAVTKIAMIVSNQAKLSKSFLEKIKDEIRDNDYLRERLWPDGGQGISSQSLSLKNGSKILSSSFYTAARGNHVGTLILDDYPDDSCIYSKAMRQKFEDILKGVFFPTLRPGGLLRIVGTPFHEEDMYSGIRRGKWGEIRHFEYPAVFHNPEDPTFVPYVLDEARHDWSWLMSQKKIVGSQTFSREYLCRPISDSSSIFPFEFLNRCITNMEDEIMVDHIRNSKRKYDKVAIGIDFAISANTGADETVVVVMGMSQGVYYIIYAECLEAKHYQEQVNAIVRINHAFNPDIVMGESNGFQRIMLDMLDEAGVKVERFVTTRFNKKSVMEGLPSMAPTIENGCLKIPYGDDYSEQMARKIMSQFNSISFIEKGTGMALQGVGAHDDAVMATFIAYKALQLNRSVLNISYI